jgi:hypothetical protein
MVANTSYPATVTVNLFGTGFTPTTRIVSNHPAFVDGPTGYSYVSATQMRVNLLGAGLSTPGSIVMSAEDDRLAITNETLSQGVVGRSYSERIDATGGKPQFRWTVTGLPPGLVVLDNPEIILNLGLKTPGALFARRSAASQQLRPRTDLTTEARSIWILGNPPEGTYDVTVSVSDSQDPVQKDTKSYKLVINSNVRLQSKLQPHVVVTSNAVTLPVVASPVLRTLSPSPVTQTANVNLSIAGGPFSNPAQGCPAGTPGVTLIWNGNPIAAPVNVSPQLLTATIPSALLANAGTATVAIESAIGVRSNALPLVINPRPVITTTTLPPAVVGTVYPPTVISRTGGTPPFTWTLSPAGAGLSIDNNGILSGAVPTPGDLTVQVTVFDALEVSDTATLNVTVVSPPTLEFLGVANPIISFDQQNTLIVTLRERSPETVTGTLNIAFEPDSSVLANRAAIDPLVGLAPRQFAIPPDGSARIGLQAGLTAGTLTVTATDLRVRGFPVTPTVVPTFTTRIAPAPPVVQNACIVREAANGVGPTSFNLRVTGFSVTRELTRARFLISGNKLGTTELALNNAAPLFGNYYDTHFVSFLYQQKIQVSGDPNDIAGISVVLENTQGASAPVQAAPICP